MQALCWGLPAKPCGRYMVAVAAEQRRWHSDGMAKRKIPLKPFDLKTEREAVGMTQDELAEQVPCTQPAVSRWELGRAKLRGAALRRVKDILAAKRRANKRRDENEHSELASV